MTTILVIEDELQTRNVFLKCLEFEGFRAYGASNGSDGIALAQRCRPDLVVCDIMMPDMDGYSVLSTLRQIRETVAIPLIFLTAKVTMSDLRKGMALGADDYLTKPCTVEQFLAAIATRLKRHEDIKAAMMHSSESSQARALSSDRDISTELQVDSFFPNFPRLVGVFKFIEQHYQEAIHLQDVAQAAGYSPAYLTSLVQEQTGRTVKRWIIERRMAQARQLLQTTTDSIRQVATDSGYADPGYFTRQFRQLHGISPQAWRQEQVEQSTR